MNCKRSMKLKKGTTEYDGLPGILHEKQSQEMTVKTEQIKKEREFFEENTCRVCLKEGNIPIFGYSGFNYISDALNTFGGILVTRGDDYPKHLCRSCNRLLQSAILFRKTAQESEKLLVSRLHAATFSKDSVPLNNEKMKLKDETLYDMDNVPIDYEMEIDLKNEKLNSNKKENIVRDEKLCNTDDKSLNNQLVEIEYNEKGQVSYNCVKCDLSFHSRKEYANHKAYKNHKKMRVTCKICNKSYASVYIKKHLELHKSEVRFICDICGKKFVIQPQLAKHRMSHFYNLPFKCSLCPYRARVGLSLKLHMRTHTGDRPYKCSQCSQSFTNKGNLNRHMLRKHSSKDFKCDQCQKEFHTKSKLEMHLRVYHSGIKEHVCDVCGKAFGYRGQMMKHQLKVHKREKVKGGKKPLYLLAEKIQDEQED